MILALPQDVKERLDRIERIEGIPALEVAHQAISIWSHLDGDERQRLGQVAIGIVVDRHRRLHRDHL